MQVGQGKWNSIHLSWNHPENYHSLHAWFCFRDLPEVSSAVDVDVDVVQEPPSG